jgi:glutamate-1-semialdehyde 2,1-aminomutase
MSQVVTQQIETLYREQFPRSAELYERACGLFPSGVTHDGRYLKPFPPYVERAAGSKKHAVDGHEIIDYWMGHGALLLGHSHPAVVEAVQRQMSLGTHYGACHELEIEWGEWVRRLVPSAEMVRFTNSGTEATLMALRVARIVTNRAKVLKFAGHFHGWHDQLIPAAEPPHDGGDYTTPGITSGVAGDLVIVPPNDLNAVEQALDRHNPACVIIEATGGRWGVVPVRGEFLRGLRRLTSQRGVILIMDEVITGFRVHPGGAQAAYGVTPDMTTLAKVVAGGLPGGCLVGRADLMQVLAFDNLYGKKMKHPGTYNANPLSAAAGIAALKIVATGEPSRQANEISRRLRAGLNELFEEKSVPWIAYGDFSLTKILPEYDGPRPDADDFLPYDNTFAKLDRRFDAALSHAFRCALLLGGVDFMGWGAMPSAAHTDDHVERTVHAFSHAIDLLRADGLMD